MSKSEKKSISTCEMETVTLTMISANKLERIMLGIGLRDHIENVEI